MEEIECTAVAAILVFICPRLGTSLLPPDFPSMEAVARTAATILLMILDVGKAVLKASVVLGGVLDSQLLSLLSSSVSGKYIYRGITKPGSEKVFARLDN